MNQTHPKIVAISGGDGSGKSTMMSWLKSQLNIPCDIVSIWDMLTSAQVAAPFKDRQAVQNYLSTLHPLGRSYFLLHCMTASLERALESPKKLILIDSYWYKYMAMEIVQGLSPVVVQQLTRALPIPDRVIFLQLSASAALARKKELSTFESGGVSDQSKQAHSFIKVQEKLASLFGQLHPQERTSIFSSENSVEENGQQIIELINQLTEENT